MKLSRCVLLLCSWLFIMSYEFTAAQTAPAYQDFSKSPRVYTRRNSFWFESNIGGTFGKNEKGDTWQYQVDYQYRRMSDGDYIRHGSTANIFKDMYQQVIRPWINYWPMPAKVRISVSPVGHWGTWSPSAEGVVTYYTEYRSGYQLTLFHKTGKLDLQQRFRHEIRFLGNEVISKGGIRDLLDKSDFPGSGYRHRLRYMVRGNYPLNKSGTTYLVLWDEIFIGLGPNVPSNKIFDQNRLVALLGKKTGSGSYPVKVEAGITWQLVPKYNMDVPPTQPDSYGSYMKSNWESNLALQVYLVFDEFHRFRGKSTK